jgi:hypothetical protein
MSYRFEDSFRTGPDAPISHIYSGMKLYMFWAEELPKTRRVSCRSKYGKLVHLVGFIMNKFVTMHFHTNASIAIWFIQAEQ